jgi:hypothetical protein
MTKNLCVLFVISDGELQMSRNDTLLLVVAGCVTGELENLSGQVF